MGQGGSGASPPPWLGADEGPDLGPDPPTDPGGTAAGPIAVLPVEFIIHGGHTVPGEVGPELTAEAEDALARFLEEDPRIPDEMRVRVVRSGPGFAGPGLVIELLSVGRTDATDHDTRMTAVERTMTAWRFVRAKLPTDQLPILSLGALRWLCLGDLHHRLGDVAAVRLLWSGCVDDGVGGPGEPGAEVLYSVIFARRRELWTYLVDARGRIVHFGTGRRG
jgi:hypothetical protein